MRIEKQNSLPAKILLQIEEQTYPWQAYALTFIGILFFRILMEHFSGGIALRPGSILHISSWFICSFTLLVALTSWFAQTPVVKVAKVILTLSPMILTPVLIDLLPIPGNEHPMGYIPVRNFTDIWDTYSQLGGPRGMTLGIKVEVVFILVSSFFYLRIKGQKVLKSVIFVLVVYTYLYCLGIAPFILEGLFSAVHVPLADKILSYSRIYWLMTSLIGLGLLASHFKSSFQVIWKDIRLIRIFHYLIMFALGAALLVHVKGEKRTLLKPYFQKHELLQLKKTKLNEGKLDKINTEFLHQLEQEIIGLQQEIDIAFKDQGFSSIKEAASPRINSSQLTSLPLFILSIFLCAIFAIVENNLEDIEIDKISNPKRPLPSGSIPLSQYKKIGYLAFGFGSLIAFLAGPEIFFYVMLLNLGYYLYSRPPLKLKRVPFLAKFILALNSFFMVLLGFTFLGGNLPFFPHSWIFFLLVPVALAGNFLDIKDYEGDKSEGIMTLPVILGLRNSKIAITIFSLFAYLTFYLIMDIDWIIYLLLPQFILHATLLNLPVYREKMIFLVYYSALIGMIGILLIF